jgi:hypothetical protein
MAAPSITLKAPELADAALADAAMSSPALDRALRLAAWVGHSRTLTANGVLRPVEAVQACDDLGIDLPGPRLRSALDVWELMRGWTTAVAAGFLELDGRHAWSAPDLPGPGGPAPDPQAVLTAWLRAATVMLDLDDEPCAVCLTALHQLQAATRPVPMEQLVEAVADELGQEVPGQPVGQECPDCGVVHDDLRDLSGFADGRGEVEDDAAGHTTDLVLGMLDFGAAAANDGVITVTQLGEMLAESVFSQHALRPDADAAAVVSAIVSLPSAVVATFAQPWLSARPTPDAARQLIAFAESAKGTERIAALAFARDLGAEAADAWRELAKRPGIGAYGRQWLAEQGELVTIDPDDDAWLTTDALCAMIDALAGTIPLYLMQAMIAQQIGDEAAPAAELVSGSGHPRAADIVALLTGRPTPVLRQGEAGNPGGQGRKARPEPIVYQLKITLRGVSKPPVWRRVLVSGSITLKELHEIIQQVMGWDNSHLHVFSAYGQEYGSPDPDLGHASDQRVRLDEVLTGNADRMRYTYDFGDDWEHDVVAEQTLTAEPGQAYPRCAAGKGACPPEDCGGVWGYARLKEILADSSHDEHEDMLDWLGLDSGEDFDPHEFSAADTDARLRSRTRSR